MENSDNKPKGRTSPANSGTPNPAKIFIQWKSKNKAFSYYNKEKEEDVLLPMPFSFIPLAKASTVKGYNHKKNKTYIANEVDDLATSIIVVNSYNTQTKERKEEHRGLYKDIKEDFDQNVKFTDSIYAAIKNKKGELSLVNIQLNGAGLHHWFDFIKKNNIWATAVKSDGFTNEIKGKVEYCAPTYKAEPISEADDIKAAELQEEINAYLAKYYADNAIKNGQPAPPAAKSEPAKTAKSSAKVAPKEEEEEEIGGDNTAFPDLEDDNLPF